jgi:hypothetical protein
MAPDLDHFESWYVLNMARQSLTYARCVPNSGCARDAELAPSSPLNEETDVSAVNNGHNDNVSQYFVSHYSRKGSRAHIFALNHH